MDPRFREDDEELFLAGMATSYEYFGPQPAFAEAFYNSGAGQGRVWGGALAVGLENVALIRPQRSTS